MLEIKEVYDTDTKEIKTYLEVLKNYLTDFKDVCETEYMQKSYVVTHSSDGFVGISENDDGFLNPYVVSFDEDLVNSYSSEEYVYKFGRDEDNRINNIHRMNILTQNVDQLALIKYPSISYLSYVQINDANITTFSMLYDVTYHDRDIIDAITCSEYHIPFVVDFNILKPLLLGFYFKKKNLTYALQDDMYEKVFFQADGKMFTLPKSCVVPEEFLKNIEEMGFLTHVPDDIKSFANGSNEELKMIEDISGSYKKVLRDKKC